MAQSIRNLALGSKIQDLRGNKFIVIAKNHYSSAYDMVKIYKEVCDNETYLKFSKIWIDEWGKYIKNKKLSRDIIDLIEDFVNVTGYDDEEILVKIIEEQQKKWRNLREEIVEGQQERKKIVWTLSICFGLMLILILI